MDELVDALDVAAGFLDRDDRRTVRGEARGDFDRDGNAGAPGDAVEHDRQGGGGGDRLVVLVEAFRGGLVVIGADLEGAGGTGFFGGDGEFDRLGGGVRAGPGHDLAAAGGEFDR